MANLIVESDDRTHRVTLTTDDDGMWTATCDQHPKFALHGHSRAYLTNAHMEADLHVDEHQP